jgi:glycosyltransferase involved in cell wall biosynthesis
MGGDRRQDPDFAMGVETAIFSPSEVGEQSDARSEFKDRLGIAGKSVILFLGRLSEKKGVVYLLDAFASLASSRDDLVLLVAGDGEEYELLRSHVDRIGIADSVNMLGYVTGESKKDCLQFADLLVLPSIITTDSDSEGLPVALLEGLAAGKICIATDVSGADDILTDGDDGFIVPQKDAHELATAINRGLDLDSVTRQKMMERARHRAAEFDWDIVAKLHYDHLFSALSSRL